MTPARLLWILKVIERARCSPAELRVLARAEAMLGRAEATSIIPKGLVSRMEAIFRSRI